MRGLKLEAGGDQTFACGCDFDASKEEFVDRTIDFHFIPYSLDVGKFW